MMQTQDAAALNTQFGIPGQLVFRQQPDGFLLLDVDNPGCAATIALQGAQLLHWTPRGQPAVIWQSPHARFATGKSVRGGVPVCWPWFGPHPVDASLPAHGFARTVAWEMMSSAGSDGDATRLGFRLRPGAETRRLWPSSSELELLVTLGSTLEMELVTRNTGPEAFILGQALHTYFNVSDIRNVKVRGLEGCSYLDKVGPEQRRQQRGAVTFSGETDRIYLDTASDCLIDDPGLQRCIRISKRGSHSTVVWNPWIEKAARLGDMGEEGYLHMLCVESSNAATDLIRVEPGDEHRLWVRYSVEPRQE